MPAIGPIERVAHAIREIERMGALRSGWIAYMGLRSGRDEAGNVEVEDGHGGKMTQHSF